MRFMQSENENDNWLSQLTSHHRAIMTVLRLLLPRWSTKFVERFKIINDEKKNCWLALVMLHKNVVLPKLTREPSLWRKSSPRPCSFPDITGVWLNNDWLKKTKSHPSIINDWDKSWNRPLSPYITNYTINITGRNMPLKKQSEFNCHLPTAN